MKTDKAPFRKSSSTPVAGKSRATSPQDWISGDSFHPISRFDFWQNLSMPWSTAPFLRAPVVDVSEDEADVVLKAEIPGLSPKDIEISHDDGVLYLRGEKKEEKEGKEKNIWHRESWHGVFSRTIPLGAGVDWEKAHAKHKDGILTITIPKIPQKENRVKINLQ